MRRVRISFAIALLCMTPVVALGQSAGSASTGDGASGAPDGPAGGSGGDPTRIPAAVSPGWGRWGWYLPYYTVQGTPNGAVTRVYDPIGLLSRPVPVVVVGRTEPTTAPPPPPGLIRPGWGAGEPAGAARVNRERAERHLTIGDRMFRVNDLKRAEDRYRQAIQANPYWASPRMRLAQIALVRGRYPLAADLLREAEIAEPGWIPTAIDVQSLYRDPDDFSRHVASLEDHLLRNPKDRDAWLVLGAQLFLARREALAADVFLRLDDPRRKPDVALAAFLDAARLLDAEPAAAAPAPPIPRPAP